MGNERVVLAVAVSAAIAVGIGVGVLIGWYSGPDRVTNTYENARREANEAISSKLINEMNGQNCKDVLWALTRDPHVAGTPQNKKLADDILANWTSYGFEANIYAYNVLLSFPSTVEGEDNVIRVLNGSDVIFESQLKEAPLDELSREKEDLILPPFNAYSASGVHSGDLVYVNYARLADFEFLQDLNPPINLTGKIAIARYGKLYRGDKAKFAAQFGAAGLILYSDPKDYAVEGAETYPDGLYLPGTGTQRGSCLDGNGDPLTQSYPAIDSAYRLAIEKSTMLPTIPIHPIGYDDAKILLENMDGVPVGEDWEGGLDLTYRYGPGFRDEYEQMEVEMSIYTENQMAYGWDVIGVIRGSVEPDRYVLIGNHRDAWGFGAIDAGSGTTAMLEISRAMSVLVEEGWRPRRSIMFCSWGAEEQGLIGSTEWVEEFAKNLGIRAVAYLNLDVAMDGTYVPDIASTPNLNRLIYEAMKKIPAPDDDTKTMYDLWKERGATGTDGEPSIGTLGSGSDYAPFLQIAGISAMDFTYTYNSEETPVASYPCYHSVYETFELVDNYYDSQFRYILAAGRLYGEMMRQLADNVILPMDPLDYAKTVAGYWDSLQTGSIGEQMEANGIDFTYMLSAVDNFTSAATDFNTQLESINKDDLLAVRRVNDQLMYLERAFIDPMGLTGRPTTKHVVFAPSSANAYAGEKFASIVDAMYNIQDLPADQEQWELVKKELSIVTYLVQSAADSLKPVAFQPKY
ncbi:N-acetylated-alpha-linked acidic dipeptidase 2-like [Lytechinus variegatus]|uniref:N-acetylated-alpha-linked acidic dipeptidase 2-like n=1 Tax=Lytechinus variegatus TaxID=7654 RepID=UPI001BB2B57C|nr:N-acetylated-alpha-linked acidic dipeptidase 2-like [Lytechinus variegatus]XP_041470147.1 N-acetylated-alpha-linked acidic dipeptidase 2-like [Lytechinus variegatus]